MIPVFLGIGTPCMSAKVTDNASFILIIGIRVPERTLISVRNCRVAIRGQVLTPKLGSGSEVGRPIKLV